MDYIIFLAIAWVISGLLAIYSICKPVFKGDKWIKPKLPFVILMVLFGPLSSLI